MVSSLAGRFASSVVAPQSSWLADVVTPQPDDTPVLPIVIAVALLLVVVGLVRRAVLKQRGD